MAVPTICVGLAGPSGVGKSAFLKALLDNEFDLASGGGTGRPRSTETLEFAHAKIYKCSSRIRASCYRSCCHLLDMEDSGCDTPGHDMERLSLSRRAGFIDCPGNQLLVPTILKGIRMADGVLILSQPTDGFSAAPTLEALAAAHMMRRSIVVVQIIKNAADLNKLDQHQKEIRKCIKQLNIPRGVEVPIVKISASELLKDIGDVCRRMISMMPVTQRQAASSSASDSPAALMVIASSCLVDPVGEEEENAVASAAAAGDATMFVTLVGRVVQGLVSIADEVEVRPGIVVKDDDGNLVCYPITLKVTSAAEGEGDGLVTLRASATIVNVGGNSVQLRLVRFVLGGDEGTGGHVLGYPLRCLPLVYDALKVNVLLLPRIGDPYTEKLYDPVPPLEIGQKLLLIIGTMPTYGRVNELTGRNGQQMTIVVTGLSPPTCATYQETILVCRHLTLSWHLIGCGTILGGRALRMVSSSS